MRAKASLDTKLGYKNTFFVKVAHIFFFSKNAKNTGTSVLSVNRHISYFKNDKIY